MINLKALYSEQKKIQGEIDSLKKQLAAVNVLVVRHGGQASDANGATLTTNKARRGIIDSLVREAVLNMEDQFTSGDILNFITKNNHDDYSVRRNSVSTVLTRLVAQGLIYVVQEGSGRMATIFKKVEEKNIPTQP